MRRSRFCKEEIIAVIKPVEAGVKVMRCAGSVGSSKRRFVGGDAP